MCDAFKGWSRACDVRRVIEPRLAERGVRFSAGGAASASALRRPRLGRRMLRLLELFLRQTATGLSFKFA